MKPFVVLLRRSSAEVARVTVHADCVEDARLLGEERAKAGDVIWEDDSEELTAEVEVQ